MSKTYECSICQHVNHSSRLHCAVCGVIPAMYSIIGKPIDCTLESLGPTEVGIASGSQTRQFNQKLNLRTMPLDYYGE